MLKLFAQQGRHVALMGEIWHGGVNHRSNTPHENHPISAGVECQLDQKTVHFTKF